MENHVDVIIIGGGINGAGLARDLSGRNCQVALFEQKDLASATSSASTKLVHGGLRYLEHYEFGLVRKALKEREVLLRNAPHIVRPLRFVLPHMPNLRPVWMIQLGLFLYDNLGGRKKLPGSHTVNLQQHITGEPLQDNFSKGFVYSDCWLDDARMVVLNAKDARSKGAHIATRHKVLKAERNGSLWTVTVKDQSTGEEELWTSKVVVNAAGPWAAELLDTGFKDDIQAGLRLVQGSHIVVDKLYEHEYCYIFQNPDGRIIFAIPYEQDYTLVGTTDKDYSGDVSEVKITSEEIEYLCQAVNQYFRIPIAPSDVRWSYSGVRPLFDDGASEAQKATRDYVAKTSGGGSEALGVHLFGGKITTYRELAETLIEKYIGPHLELSQGPWTAKEPLPGGDLSHASFYDFMAELRQRYSQLPKSFLWRLGRLYGSECFTLLGEAQKQEELGRCWADGLLTEAEIQFVCEHEWCQSLEDLIWRRTKIGLKLSEEEQKEVESLFF